MQIYCSPFSILFALGFTVFASCNTQCGACGCGEHGSTFHGCVVEGEGEGFECLQTTYLIRWGCFKTVAAVTLCSGVRRLPLTPWESNMVNRLQQPTHSYLARSRSAMSLSGEQTGTTPLLRRGWL